MSASDHHYDLIIIGAGPSGGSAALEAAGRGLKLLLLDENQAAGGQVWRAPPSEFELEEPAPGDELRQALAKAAIDFRPDYRVWSIEREDRDFTVQCFSTDGLAQFTTTRLIVAAGARERIVPVEGWTLPGVVGLAGATVMIKAQKLLPGQAVVVAGSGPLLYLVANMILDGGGKVVAVVDARSTVSWLSRLPALLTRPGLAAKGALWMARLRAKAIPIHSQSRVTAIMGSDHAEAVWVEALDGQWRVKPGQPGTDYLCDAVCLGDGLAPSTEITRLLGAEHDYRADEGGWVVRSDAAGRTSISGLYVCGDGAGIRGVDAAPLRGRAAALAAVADHQSDTVLKQASLAVAESAQRAGRFGKAMSSLAAPNLAAYADIKPDTVVCRCEGVTRQRIEISMSGGAHSLNQIKSETRCGMGPCGARFCADTTSALLAKHLGVGLDEVPLSASRPPLRPVPLSAIAADFDYDSLPIPAPAPL